MRSTYSRLNVSGASQSCYDSNRYPHGQKVQDITAISPLPIDRSQLNLGQSSRFDRSDIQNDKNSHFDGMMNYS